jgi:hypothetical protein
VATCRVDDCERPHAARGLCHPHWKRWRKYGDPQAPKPAARRIPVVERFWPKVAITEPSECWEWQASRDALGYGYFRVVHGDTMKRAHRVAWELTHGPIPDEMLVCHTCDNPPCVNPAHLFLGDNAANCADKVAKNRQAKTPPHWGESSPGAKVSTEAVRQIRARYAAGGISQRELGEEYGIGQTHVGRIISGKRRRRE